MCFFSLEISEFNPRDVFLYVKNLFSIEKGHLVFLARVAPEKQNLSWLLQLNLFPAAHPRCIRSFEIGQIGGFLSDSFPFP